MRITQASNDDWIVFYRLRKDGRTINRVLGVSGHSTRQQALDCTRLHINPLRVQRAGTAWEVLDEQIMRMYEWRARKLAEHASPSIQAQVRSASRV